MGLRDLVSNLGISNRADIANRDQQAAETGTPRDPTQDLIAYERTPNDLLALAHSPDQPRTTLLDGGEFYLEVRQAGALARKLGYDKQQATEFVARRLLSSQTACLKTHVRPDSNDKAILFNDHPTHRSPLKSAVNIKRLLRGPRKMADVRRENLSRAKRVRLERAHARLDHLKKAGHDMSWSIDTLLWQTEIKDPDSPIQILTAEHEAEPAMHAHVLELRAQPENKDLVVSIISRDQDHVPFAVGSGVDNVISKTAAGYRCLRINILKAMFLDERRIWPFTTLQANILVSIFLGNDYSHGGLIRIGPFTLVRNEELVAFINRDWRLGESLDVDPAIALEFNTALSAIFAGKGGAAMQDARQQRIELLNYVEVNKMAFLMRNQPGAELQHKDEIAEQVRQIRQAKADELSSRTTGNIYFPSDEKAGVAARPSTSTDDMQVEDMLDDGPSAAIEELVDVEMSAAADAEPDAEPDALSTSSAPSRKIRTSHGAVQGYAVVSRTYQKADSLEGLYGSIQLVNALDPPLVQARRAPKAGKVDNSVVPVWQARRDAAAASDDEGDAWCGEDGQSDGEYEPAPNEDGGGGGGAGKQGAQRDGRAGLKHRLCKLPIEVPAKMAYRPLVGPALDTPKVDRPGDAWHAIVDATLVHLGSLGDYFTAILRRALPAASRRHSLHPFLLTYHSDDGGRNCLTNLFYVLQRLADPASTAGYKELGKPDGAVAALRPAGGSPNLLFHYVAMIYNLEYGHPVEPVDRARDADYRKFRQDRLKDYSDKEIAFLAMRKIPPFLYEICKEVYRTLDIPVPQVPAIIFVPVFAQVGVGHNTAVRRACGSNVTKLAKHLSKDIIANCASFVARVEHPPDAFGASPQPAGAPASPSPVDPSLHRFFRLLASPDPFYSSIRQAVAHQVDLYIRSYPLCGESDDVDAWQVAFSADLGQLLTGIVRRHHLEGLAQCRNAALQIAVAVSAVGRTIGSVYEAAAGDDKLESATLHLWITSQPFASQILHLAAFQDLWLDWIGTPRNLGVHARSIVINNDNITNILVHAQQLVDTALLVVNRSVDNLNAVGSSLGQPAVADGVRLRASYHRLAFVQQDVTPKPGTGDVNPTDIRPCILVDGLHHRISRLVSLLDLVFPPSRGSEPSERFKDATAAVFAIIFRLPAAGRLIPAAYLTASFEKVNFLMLDPARVKAATRDEIGQPVTEFFNRILNLKGYHAGAKAPLSLRNWATFGYLFKYAQLELYEMRGPAPRSSGSSSRPHAQPVPPFVRVRVADGKDVLEWHSSSTRTVKAIKYAGERAVVVRRLDQVRSRALVIEELSGAARSAPLPPPLPPKATKSQKSAARQAQFAAADALASAEHAALAHKREQAKLGHLEKAGKLDPKAIAIGFDPGEFNAFAGAILPLFEPAADGSYATGTSAFFVRARQIAAQEQVFQQQKQQSHAKSTIKCLLNLIKQNQPDRLDDIAKLEREWLRDLDRQELVLKHHLMHDARLRMMADDVVKQVEKVAKDRGATPEEPVLLIVANGIGTKGSKRSKSATGSDQRQKPLDFVYKALNASPLLKPVFVDTDEAWTSQSCPRPSCRAECAKENKTIEMEYPNYIETDTPCYRILRCVHCRTVYERDYVGAANIAQVAVFNLLTGLHLFSREVEQALGLGMRPSHMTKAEKKGAKGKKRARPDDDDLDPGRGPGPDAPRPDPRTPAQASSKQPSPPAPRSFASTSTAAASSSTVAAPAPSSAALARARTATTSSSATGAASSSAIPGHCGLVNLGNSCYLNVVVQLFARLPHLSDYFLSTASSGPSSFEKQTEYFDPHDPALAPLRALGTLVGSMTTALNSLRPTDLLTAVYALDPVAFPPRRPADASELLARLLALVERLQPTSPPTLLGLGFMLRIKYTCPVRTGAPPPRRTMDTPTKRLYVLKMRPGEDHNLFTVIAGISSGRDGRCGDCADPVHDHASTRLYAHRDYGLGEVFGVHFARIGDRVKVMDPVFFPVQFDELKLFSDMHVRTPASTTIKYELSAVVHHLGEGLQGGHYFVDVYDDELKAWIRYNDSIVQRVSLNDVLDYKTAILVFYRRKVHDRAAT